MGIKIAATIWGFAEATLFFIVPDVLLTWVALDRLRLALYCCVLTVAGALCGGAVMYVWGNRDSTGAMEAVGNVPAVSSDMLNDAKAQTQERDWLAMFRAAFTGVPYKIYAATAGALDYSFFLFMLLSIPARLVRFVLIVFVTSGICRFCSNSSLVVRRIVHMTAWTIFYVWYFWRHKS